MQKTYLKEYLRILRESNNRKSKQSLAYVHTMSSISALYTIHLIGLEQMGHLCMYLIPDINIHIDKIK
jgi:hypothetical protein